MRSSSSSPSSSSIGCLNGLLSLGKQYKTTCATNKNQPNASAEGYLSVVGSLRSIFALNQRASRTHSVLAGSVISASSGDDDVELSSTHLSPPKFAGHKRLNRSRESQGTSAERANIILCVMHDTTAAGSALAAAAAADDDVALYSG